MLDRNRMPYRAPARGGLIACALLLTCGATSNPPAPSGGNGHAVEQQKASCDSQNGGSADEQPQRAAAVVDHKASDHDRATPANAQQEGNWNSPEGWTAIFTGGLFVATLLLWFFTALMWLTTRRVANEGKVSIEAANRNAKAAEDAILKMDEIAKRQAVDMEKSVWEATRAASAMQDVANHIEISNSNQINFSKRQLRAYVHVDLRPDAKTRRNGWEVIYSLSVVNSGQTPAYDVVIEGNICVADHVLNKELNPPVVSGQPSKASAYPGQAGVTADVRSKPALTDEEFSSLAWIDAGTFVKSSPSRLYLYGKITYRDVFGDGHTTYFRCRTNGLQGYEAAFSWCAEGNEAE